MNRTIKSAKLNNMNT